MDEQNNSKINELYSLAVENNRLLKSLARQNKLALISKIIYFALIVAITIGAFSFVKKGLGSALGGGMSNNSSFQNEDMSQIQAPTQKALQDLIDLLE